MKTTLNLRDDIVRRAKAKAALRGQSLARYVEEGIVLRLEAEEAQPVNLRDWINTLPKLSKSAVRELESNLQGDDFRPIEPKMWE